MKLCRICGLPAKPGKKQMYLCQKHLNEYHRNYYSGRLATSRQNSRLQYHKQTPLQKRVNWWKTRYKVLLTVDDLENMLLKQLRSCAICKTALELSWHLDHIVPTALGGKSELSNLQILCQKCNVGKYKFLQQEYIDHCLKVAQVYNKDILVKV